MTNIQMHELVFDPKRGRDTMQKVGKLNFDPAYQSSPEEAAKAFYNALIEWAVNHYGMTRQLAEGEIALFAPERTQNYSGDNVWCVVFESGPYDWAIDVSMQMSGPWGHCEPYYGFDLHFYGG